MYIFTNMCNCVCFDEPANKLKHISIFYLTESALLKQGSELPK